MIKEIINYRLSCDIRYVINIIYLWRWVYEFSHYTISKIISTVDRIFMFDLKRDFRKYKVLFIWNAILQGKLQYTASKFLTSLSYTALDVLKIVLGGYRPKLRLKIMIQYWVYEYWTRNNHLCNISQLYKCYSKVFLLTWSNDLNLVFLYV